MNPLKQLESAGQSPWLDYVSRRLIQSGEIATLIERDGLKGMTSNPAIFEKSIADSKDYDAALGEFQAAHDHSVTEIYEHLAISDIRGAADALLPVYQATAGVDGYISLEVSPYLAHDQEGTIAEARRLWEQVNRPNLMVKVPATPAGIGAVRALITEGININVTLLFALEAYQQVAEAYISGLEARASHGNPVAGIASVASFFVSRIDSMVDQALDDSLNDGLDAATAAGLRGQIAIANAKLAYAHYEDLIKTGRWLKLAKKGAMPQRLLWASTSSKNPAYPDTLYVDRLIGRDTVNTIPPATMDAFRDHGTAKPDTVCEDAGQAARQLRQLAELGISLGKITDRLLEDGVQQFADAFDRLLGVVARRRATLRSATPSYQFAAGPVAAPIAAAAEEWRRQGKVRRLWARDASLWTGADESRWLGWLDIVADEEDQPGKWRDLAADVADMVITDIVLLGIGGSSLGPEVISAVFASVRRHAARGMIPRFHVQDSTDPAAIAALEAKLSDYRHTLFIVASKSGSTLEPNLFLAYFYNRVQESLIFDAGKQFIAITDPGSALDHQARELKFWHVFYGLPQIGGRYSVLSPFGLAPMAALGIDTARFLATAQQMVRSCGADVPPAENPAVQLGLALGAAARAGRNKLTIYATPGLAALGAWIEQLVAESTGKDGTGIIPVDGEPLAPAGAYGDDRFFLFYALAGESDPAQDHLKADLIAAGHPVAAITVDDPYHLGQEFFRLELATGVACSVMGINPLDQPDVEASKSKTRALTTALEETGFLAPGTPILTEQGVSVYADAANAAALAGATDLQDLLARHFARLHPHDYLALLAFIERTAEHTESLNLLRAALVARRRVATCLGFGPRFLHSTGQAHKGGPASGVFLQITTDDPFDLAIPGHGFSFSAIKAAQAQGDLAVLYERGRRAVRVHVANLGPAWEYFMACALGAV